MQRSNKAAGEILIKKFFLKVISFTALFSLNPLFSFACVSSADSSHENSGANKRFSVGVKFGASQSFISWHTPPEDLQLCVYNRNSKMINSPVFGLQGYIRLNQHFYLQPEVYFGQRSGSFSFISTVKDTAGDRKWVTDDMFYMQNVDFDLSLHFRTLNEKFFLFATAGAYYSVVYNVMRMYNSYFMTCNPDGTTATSFPGDQVYDSKDDSKNKYKITTKELKTYDIGLAASAGFAKNIGRGNVYIELRSTKGLIDNISDSYRERTLKIYYPKTYNSVSMHNFTTCIMIGYNYNF